MEIRKVMEKCFEMQLKFGREQFHSYPKAPYIAEYDDNGIFIKDSIDEEGYAEWKPQKQIEKIEFEKIKEKIGNELHHQLKEYYSTYYFMQLIGKLNEKIMIYIDNIPFGSNIIERIIENHINNNVVSEYFDNLDNSDFFEIGMATVDGNDGYLLCFDNNSGNVYLVYFAEKIICDLNMTLYELFDAFMEVY